MACGLDWSEPVSHFENVDFQGNVHIVRKLGEVQKFPIYLIFNSAYGNSPYAGSGFEIPILESRMWQADENRFQMKSPSGWLWIFQRTKVPNVLEGNAGWKGLINNDTITLWAPCGDKISFKNGKIVSMQLKGDKFDYAYKNNRVESIQMNGRTILEVKSDDKTGNVTGINLPNTRKLIGLQQAESRPRPETAGGMSLVSRVDKTLSEVMKPDGSKETFEFGVNEKMNPTLKCGERNITWSAVTKKMIRDGEWDYTAISNDKITTNVFIARTSTSGKSEYWLYNSDKGIDATRNSDGIEKCKSWFTSGELNGKLRSIHVKKDGEWASYIKYFYTDKSILARTEKRFQILNQQRLTALQGHDNSRGAQTRITDIFGHEGQLVQSRITYE